MPSFNEQFDKRQVFQRDDNSEGYLSAEIVSYQKPVNGRQENVLAANETAAKMEKNLQKRRRCTPGTFDFSIIFINSSCSPQP